MDFRTMGNGQLLRKYVLPQMIGLVLNSVYFIVDGLFIGNLLGDAALAAAGVAVPVVECLIAFSMLMAVGSGVSIASAQGRGDREEAHGAFSACLVATAVASLGIALLGCVFVTPLSRILGAGGAILGDTVTYLAIFLAFSPFLVFSYLLSTLVRNDGAPRLAMWALAVGALANVALDYVLMVHVKMGIGGAALATGLGPVISVIILLPHFLRGRGSLRWRRRSLSRGRLVGILSLGLPAFVMEFSIGLITYLYNLAILRQGYGDEGLAVYMVMGYAALICTTAFLGAAEGAQPVVSYLSGASDPGRIRALFRYMTAFLLLLSLVFYGVLAGAGESVFALFLGQGNLSVWAGRAARIYFICLPFGAVNILASSFLQAAGHRGVSLRIALCRVSLPLMAALIVLPTHLGETGLWLAMALSETLTLCLAAYSRRHSSSFFPSEKTA